MALLTSTSYLSTVMVIKHLSSTFVMLLAGIGIFARLECCWQGAESGKWLPIWTASIVILPQGLVLRLPCPEAPVEIFGSVPVHTSSRKRT